MLQAYFVYKLESIHTDKAYIGVTANPARRLKEHRKNARKNSGYALHAAMRKYGVDTFKMTVLYSSKEKDHIFEIEPQFIREHNTLSPNGYNISKGGDAGPSGPEHSKNIKNIWASKTPQEMVEFKEKMKIVGADISEETRKKRSDAAKAQHADPTKKAKYKAAIQVAAQDPERRKGNSERAKARWADPVFIAKMKAKYDTPEQREKKSKASKARWAATTSSTT